MSRKKSQAIRDQALEIFQSHGGILKTSEALELGIHPRILYELRDEGKIEEIMKGVYGLPGLPGVDQPDFIAIGKKVPKGVICLISALYYHGLTVQIPRWVDVAIRQSYHPPKFSYPPVQFHWFSDRVFESGVEMYDMGGMMVGIYSREKSIVDCFRLRRKVGVSVAVEALNTYWRSGQADLGMVEKFARESRVLKIMTPYIESIIHDQS